MSRGNIVALLHALGGAGALFAGFLTKEGFEGASDILKLLGYAIFAVGMLLFAYTVVFLREAFRGSVKPTTENLIMEGPYRFVRHPLYLSMFITIIGISIRLRSIWGLAITFVVFLPLTVLRARLEEASLNDKFGSEWEDYVRNTYFLVPLVY